MTITLSENIRTFRKARGLTQEQLAEVLGVTVGAVYKWESGLSQPELRSLQRPRQAGQSRRYLSDCKLRKPSLVCQAGKRYADTRYACQTGGKRRADEGYRYNR